eukprot:11185825-Lingulodinium_polyedra.AAC.1
MPGLGIMETSHHLVEGLSLKEKLLIDRRAARESGQKLGPLYWEGIKKKYGKGNIKDELVVKDSSEQALETAITTNTHARNKDLLTSWLSTTKMLRQKEMVAVGRLALETCPSSSAKACKFVIEFMKCLHRLGLCQKFKEEIAVLSGVFDAALVKTYSQMKAENMGPSQWWSSFSDIASLIVDAEKCEKIFNETSSWENVKTEIDAVCAKSAIGQKLFAAAQCHVQNGAFAAAMTAELAKLNVADITQDIMGWGLGGGQGLHACCQCEGVKASMLATQSSQLPQDLIEGVKASMLAASAKLGKKASVEKRSFTLPYKTLEIQVIAMNPAQEIDLRVACLLKQGMPAAQLPQLPFESEVFRTS